MNMLLYQILALITLEKNNEFKISASTWNEEFELPDRSYSVADVQDYFENIIKK